MDSETVQKQALFFSHTAGFEQLGSCFSSESSSEREMRSRAGSVGRQEMTQGIPNRRGLVSLNPLRPPAFPAMLFARVR